MALFERLIPSREVKAVLGALKEIAYTQNSSTFEKLKQKMKHYIYSHTDEVHVALAEHSSPRLFIHTLILNWVSDELSTNKYIPSKGVLNEDGVKLLAALDYSIGELKKLRIGNERNLDDLRRMVLMNIRHSGL